MDTMEGCSVLTKGWKRQCRHECALEVRILTLQANIVADFRRFNRTNLLDVNERQWRAGFGHWRDVHIRVERLALHELIVEEKTKLISTGIVRRVLNTVVLSRDLLDAATARLKGRGRLS